MVDCRRAPKTEAARARIAEAQRRRWGAYRDKRQVSAATYPLYRVAHGTPEKRFGRTDGRFGPCRAGGPLSYPS
jgi:hypothetical protein